jgi:hypothetical protein
VGEVEQQTVPGEMKDLTAELPPAETEKPATEAG